MRTVFKIRKGNLIHSHNVTLEVNEKRILFTSSPFALKDEIKSFRGPRWHGFDKENPRKVWSIENCPRNAFQIRALMGEDVYEHFDQPLVEHDLRPELMDQQVDMVNRALTYHYQIWGAEQGLGKSLAALETIEKSGKKNWWFVGPIPALKSVEREIAKWGISDDINLKMMTYDKLVQIQRYDFDSIVIPDGIFFDECDMLKTPTTHRTVAAQWIADSIREKHGMDGYVVPMCGTVVAKEPSDLWSQCEIAWPGFLREGSLHAFKMRYGIMEKGQDGDGVTFTKRTGWRKDEVALLPERYDGLMTVYRKEDWIDLPAKEYHTIRLEPSPKCVRVARSLAKIAPSTIVALTYTRALSSGFQYVNRVKDHKECPVCEGTGKYEPHDTCPKCEGSCEIPVFERVPVRVKTPKDAALEKLLDKAESCGRIVIAASFKGSIARCRDVCYDKGWSVVCVDGDGWRVYTAEGKLLKDEEALEYWETHEGKVAFVGNPGSCRYGITLTLAWILVFYDNDFSAGKRLQMEDRIHRISMDVELGAHIYDLIHLPVDGLILGTLKDNKEMELLSLGAINESLGIGECEEELLETM